MIVAVIFTVGFLIGWGIKSDIRSGGGYHQSHSDRIIDEMRTQRANDYLNNPIVKEMQRQNPRNDVF